MSMTSVTSAGCILFARSSGVWYIVLGVKMSGALDKFIGLYTHFTGKIEFGESCFEAAVRETKEETGYAENRFFDRFNYTGIEFKSVSKNGIVGMTYVMAGDVDNINAVLGKCGDISGATRGEISRMVAVRMDTKLNGNRFYLKSVLEQGVREFESLLRRNVKCVVEEKKTEFLNVKIHYSGRTSLKKIVICNSSCGVQFWTENGVICGGFMIESGVLKLSRTKDTLDSVRDGIGLNPWDNGVWYRADIIS